MRNRTIFKYRVALQSVNDIEMPSGAFILSAQLQNNELQVWALVNTDPECPKQTRRIEVYGTGHEINNTDELRFIDTVQMGSFVWHLFERPL